MKVNVEVPVYENDGRKDKDAGEILEVKSHWNRNGERCVGLQ